MLTRDLYCSEATNMWHDIPEGENKFLVSLTLVQKTY
jgi:hypothetical protein